MPWTSGGYSHISYCIVGVYAIQDHFHFVVALPLAIIILIFIHRYLTLCPDGIGHLSTVAYFNFVYYQNIVHISNSFTVQVGVYIPTITIFILVG